MDPESTVRQRVIVPPDWTAQQDREFFVERWGESEDYHGDVRRNAINAHRELDQVVDRALRHFGVGRQWTKSLSQKLDLLESKTVAQAPSQAYPDRFAAHVDYCRSVESEYWRLMADQIMREDVDYAPFPVGR